MRQNGWHGTERRKRAPRRTPPETRHAQGVRRDHQALCDSATAARAAPHPTSPAVGAAVCAGVCAAVRDVCGAARRCPSGGCARVRRWSSGSQIRTSPTTPRRARARTHTAPDGNGHRNTRVFDRSPQKTPQKISAPETGQWTGSRVARLPIGADVGLAYLVDKR